MFPFNKITVTVYKLKLNLNQIILKYFFTYDARVLFIYLSRIIIYKIIFLVKNKLIVIIKMHWKKLTVKNNVSSGARVFSSLKSPSYFVYLATDWRSWKETQQSCSFSEEQVRIISSLRNVSFCVFSNRAKAFWRKKKWN